MAEESKRTGRPCKNYTHLNCKVEQSVYDDLQKFVDETGMSKTATVEKALIMFIKHYNKTGRLI